jgi:crotonobetainyl-CoA:carnitine CoA-transferase CaiB-like acyl-CoA transferase
VLTDPQLAALGQMQALAEIDGFAPGLPIELAGFSPPHAACPRVGQHTAEILRSSGFSGDEIRELAGRGIIAIG